MIAGDINYGPRLYCFMPNQRVREMDFAPLRESTEPELCDSGTDSENEETENSVSDESSTYVTKESRDQAEIRSVSEKSDMETDATDSEPKETTRERELVGPLQEQLRHVTALSRLTSHSRVALIRVLADIHNDVEAIEELMNETKDEVYTSLDKLMEWLNAEDSLHATHMAKIDSILSPIRQRYDALQQLNMKITPLAKKVSANDTTTNLFRLNTSIAKQALAEMDDMDTLRKEPSGGFDFELGELVSELMSAMSAFRESLLMIDRYMSRSEVWQELKEAMVLGSSGIEKTVLDEYPATSLKNYLDYCPSSSLSSGIPYSSPMMEQSSQPIRGVSNEIKLEAWTSASSLTELQSSCISPSEVLSEKMSSGKRTSSIAEESSSGDKFIVDISGTADTMSNYSSFEEAEFLTPDTTAMIKNQDGLRGEAAQSLSDLRTALQPIKSTELHNWADPYSEDLHTAIPNLTFSRHSGVLKTAISSEDMQTAIEHVALPKFGGIFELVLPVVYLLIRQGHTTPSSVEHLLELSTRIFLALKFYTGAAGEWPTLESGFILQPIFMPEYFLEKLDFFSSLNWAPGGN
ncbi:unnamed protein product [Haemonchus placei]|uniref:PH domain-containing protein n=1 Tax=Haemonchus placei TaxID=6290 RepID=A0A158QPH2_HAEPC|nr:unnamed protein product [Haemonchus placei]